MMLLHKSQAYQYENGPPISSFQGPSNAVPRFNGGPKVVLSDETFQMLLKGETFTRLVQQSTV